VARCSPSLGCVLSLASEPALRELAACISILYNLFSFYLFSIFFLSFIFSLFLYFLFYSSIFVIFYFLLFIKGAMLQGVITTWAR
jgi:hypothetical protein